MFTRFQENVRRYPVLFTFWLIYLAGCVAGAYVMHLLGRPVDLADGIADLIVSSVLAGAIYLWIFTNGRRTAIVLHIADLLEGREVCTVAAHEPDFDAMYEEERLEENDEEETL